ncbi:MAG: hypothetical protein OXT67_11660 [Zetaproteobacteria bacterium]|nr:hypothetical protein [Zetaproteobacteria bacterium]
MRKHIHFWTLMAALMLPSTWLAAAASSTDEITAAPAEADTATESALEQEVGLRRERYLQVIAQCQRIYTEVKGNATAEQNAGPQAPESLEMFAESCPTGKMSDYSDRLCSLDRYLQNLERIDKGQSTQEDKRYIPDHIERFVLEPAAFTMGVLAIGCLFIVPAWLGIHSHTVSKSCSTPQCPEGSLKLGCSKELRCYSGANSYCDHIELPGCFNFAHDSANLQPYDIDKNGFCVFPSLPVTIQDQGEVEKCTEFFQLTHDDKATGGCPQGCIIPDEVCWNKDSQQLVQATNSHSKSCKAKAKRFVTAAWGTPVAYIGLCITEFIAAVIVSKIWPEPEPADKLSPSQEKKAIRAIKKRVTSSFESFCQELNPQD